MPSLRAVLCRSLWIAFAALLGACGGKTSDAAPGDTTDGGVDGATPIDSGAPDSDGSPDVPVACPSEPVTKELVAATPRKDAELEQLALLLGSSIVADDALYARVVRDVGAIRAKMPSLAAIKVRAPYPQKLHVIADRATAKAMEAHAVWPFVCHNAFWGGTEGTYSYATDGTNGGTDVTFKGLYAIDRLACVYRTIPGVIQVQGGDTLVGDGPVLFAWIEGTTHHYAFDQAGGDCPAGCTSHHVWHWSSVPDGTVTLVEELPEGSAFPSWWSYRFPKLDACLTR